MKKSQRYLAALLSAVMVIGMLSGCGGAATSESAPASDAGSGSEAAPVEEMRTLSVMGSVNTEIWDYVDKQNITIRLAELCAEKNLELDVMPVAKEQYKTTIQTTLAAGKNMPDMVNLFGLDDGTPINLGKNGVLVDVLPLIDQYSDGTIQKTITAAAPDLWGTATTVEGAAYWFPFALSIQYKDGAGFNSCMLPTLRLDWLKKLDMEMPTTLDGYIEAMRAFRENDVNGNGEKDECIKMFTGTASPFDIWGPVFGLPPKHVDINPVTMKAESPWLKHDNVVKYFEFWNQMVKEGLLPIDMIGAQNEYVVEQEKLNKIGSLSSWILSTWIDHNVVEYDGEYRGCMPFVVPEDETYVMCNAPHFATQRMAITRDCEDPEAAVDFMDIMYGQEVADMINAGVEGKDYTINEDGTLNVPKPEDVTPEEWVQQGHGRGSEFWLPIYGGMQLAKADDQLSVVKDIPEIMCWADKYAYGGNDVNRYFYNGAALMAPPTSEEAERYVAIMNDLATYMDEVAIKLVTGEYAIEDIDQYIDTMKEMGLEEAVAIWQARADRFAAAQNK